MTSRPIRKLILVVFAIAAAACASPTAAHWTGDDVHVVDGHWMQTELSCDDHPTVGCGRAISAAENSLSLDAAQVLHAATAHVPGAYIESDGRTVLLTRSGSSPEFVVLDLKDGTRRVTGYGCLGVPGPPPSGTDNCGTTSMDEYRVGHEPVIPVDDSASP